MPWSSGSNFLQCLKNAQRIGGLLRQTQQREVDDIQGRADLPFTVASSRNVGPLIPQISPGLGVGNSSPQGFNRGA